MVKDVNRSLLSKVHAGFLGLEEDNVVYGLLVARGEEHFSLALSQDWQGRRTGCRERQTGSMLWLSAVWWHMRYTGAVMSQTLLPSSSYLPMSLLGFSTGLGVLAALYWMVRPMSFMKTWCVTYPSVSKPWNSAAQVSMSVRHSSAEILAQLLGAGYLCYSSTALLAGLISLCIACHCSPGAKSGTSLDTNEVQCIYCML